MRAIGFLVAGVVVLIASLALACGDDDGDDAAVGGVASGGGAGLVRPNTFMTNEGQRYELVNMLLDTMVDESEFREIGLAAEADIELGDLRVFEREGDSTVVFTYSAPTADDGGLWLAWRPVS